VAHLDHALRPESAEDAAWVAAQAAALGIGCVVARVDVRGAAAGRGVEEVGRRLRYEFLARVAEQVGAGFVATAHTADDQAETVLFNALRGTGLRGLRGIPARRRLSKGVAIVRPLLGVTRREVEEHLAALGQAFLTDLSNRDAAYTRNRLRNDLMPRLREGVNPRLDESLRRLAGQAEEVAEFLTRCARRELRAAAVEMTEEVIRLRCDRLRTRPRVLVREVIALAWRRAGWPRQAMGFAHWDALAGIAIDGGRRTLPGGTDARRRRGELVLRRPAP
jgi:tRNA(Ile)-lysidine synthase